MNATVRLLSVALALSASFATFAAEDAEAEAENTTENGAEPKDAADKKAVKDDTGVNDRPFTTLPLCGQLDGVAEVKKPGAADWIPIEEGKFYPLGSVFRTVGEKSQMTLLLGRYVELTLGGDSVIGTRAQGLGAKDRMVTLLGGTVSLKVPSNFPEGILTISTPGFTVQNMAGESRYTYVDKGDGNEVTVRCVTGVLAVSGRHFSISKMSVADEVRIRTTADNLFTGLYGTSGDFGVILDQGLVQTMDVETQQVKVAPKTLDWKLSPKTSIRIQRAVPAIGQRMAVTTMTFDAAGLLKNRCAFTEGLFEVNSGELGPKSKQDLAAAEKRAAEASETVEADAEPTEEGAGEPSAKAPAAEAPAAEASADLEF